MRPMPWAPPVTSAVFLSRLKSADIPSRHRDHDLADLVFVLQKPERLSRAIEREAALDHRLYLLPLHKSHHGLEIVEVADIGADDRDVLEEQLRRVDRKLPAAGRAVNHH